MNEGGVESVVNRSVPVKVKFGYSAGLFGISMVQTSVSVLIVFFYTDVLLIPAAAAGVIVFIGTLVDACASLLAAWVANRHSAASGRYRPLLLAIAAPLAMFFALMFMRPDLPTHLLWLYAGVMHLCYRACYAFTLTPHSALISRLTTDADERAAIGAWKAIANNLGLIAAAYLGLGLIEKLGGQNLARGFACFGIIFGIVAGGAILLSALLTRERGDDRGGDTANLLPALRLIFRNDQLLLILGATLLFFTCYMVMNGGVVYFFKYVVMRPEEAKLAIVAVGVGGLVMPAMWSHCIRLTSKGFVWALGCLMISLTFLAIYAIGIVGFVPLMLAYFAIGAGKSAAIVNFYAMTADAVDYGHWKDGAKAESYAFGMLSLANKSGTALGGGLLGFLLEWSHFKVNVAQTALTTGRLWMAICLVPAFIALVSGVLGGLFRIDASRHRDMIKAINERQGQSEC